MSKLMFERGLQTLCRQCRRRVQSNGDRFIHLVIYARGMHDADPDLNQVGDGADVWHVESLKLLEAPEEDVS